MKSKNSRLDAIKIIISSKEVGSQEELLQELAKEGFQLTQATLSRDLKQLKVAKAASMNGNYVYVLPNNTMYKRMTEQHSASEMLMHNGFISIEFSPYKIRYSVALLGLLFIAPVSVLTITIFLKLSLPSFDANIFPTVARFVEGFPSATM